MVIHDGGTGSGRYQRVVEYPPYSDINGVETVAVAGIPVFQFSDKTGVVIVNKALAVYRPRVMETVLGIINPSKFGLEFTLDQFGEVVAHLNSMRGKNSYFVRTPTMDHHLPAVTYVERGSLDPSVLPQGVEKMVLRHGITTN